MITINLGNKEAYKIYKTLKGETKPVLKGFSQKLEARLFDLLEEHLQDLESEES